VIVRGQQIDAVGGIRTFVKECLPTTLELAQHAGLNAIFHRRCSDDKLIAKRSRAAHCVLVASKTVDKLDRILVRLHRSTIIVRITKLTTTEHVLVTHTLAKCLVLESRAANIRVQDDIVHQVIAQMLGVSGNSNHEIFNVAEKIADGFQ
jgi:hypothetical protein